MKRFRELMDKYDVVGDVRGIGLMVGIEFVKDKKSKEKEIDSLAEAIVGGVKPAKGIVLVQNEGSVGLDDPLEQPGLTLKAIERRTGKTIYLKRRDQARAAAIVLHDLYGIQVEVGIVAGLTP